MLVLHEPRTRPGHCCYSHSPLFSTGIAVHHSVSTAIGHKFSTSNMLHRHHHQQLVELPFSTAVFWPGVNEYSISFLQDLLHEVVLSNKIVSSIAAGRTWGRIVLRCNHVGVSLRLVGRVVLMVGPLLCQSSLSQWAQA